MNFVVSRVKNLSSVLSACGLISPGQTYFRSSGLNNGPDPDNDEVNSYEIVKYLGKNHYNDSENNRDYAHQ